MRLSSTCAAGLISFAAGLGIGDYTASASTYVYSLVGTLSDGGSVSGNFSIDWGVSSGILNVSSLTITDPIFSGTLLNLQAQTQFGICSGTSCAAFHLNPNPTPFSLGINLAFSPPDPNGAISLLLLPSFSRVVAQRFSPTFVDTIGDFTAASVTQASLIETPGPAALPLFGTGLGVLGLLGWWRKRAGRARN